MKKETTSPFVRRRRLVIGILLWLLGAQGESLARVNPLTLIDRQIQKPNVLILFDTSTSMMNLPGAKDLDFSEAGTDCDNGDKYCRDIGVQGRCFYSSAGRMGPGVRRDYLACTASSQCNAVGYCKSSSPKGCLQDSDCGSGNTCKGKCSSTGNSCTKDSDCGGSAKCQGICSDTPGAACTSDDGCPAGQPCAFNAADFCPTDGSYASRIKMCQISMRQCYTNADCTGAAGDTCGPASSRAVVAKRVINRAVQDFFGVANFGFMTFIQSNYFPYFQINSSSITYETRTAFLSRAQLESASSTCFSASSGPTATCTLNGTSYTRQQTTNSRYRLNRGSYFDTKDASWDTASSCQVACVIAGEGTGMYLGSYYTYSVPIGTPSTTTAKVFSDYVGKTRTSQGKTYIYYDPPQTVRNEGNVYADAATDYIDAQSGDVCSSTMGGLWDENRVPFMDTAKDLSSTNATTMARKISAMAEKAGFGGIITNGSTPSGCALKNEGTGADPAYSAYHYMAQVKTENSANGVTCRPNIVLFVTDGVPNGPGEDDCSNPACSTEPLGASCSCKAVASARSLYKDLGTKVYVVGFSSAVSSAYASASLNNMAKAGGTTGAFFAVQEQELYDSISSAIYDSVLGSYSTSPVTAGGSSSGGSSNILLDARTDFPSWRGHLVAYDVSAAVPVVKWDAATGFDATVHPDFWKTRNVWTSKGSEMIKVQVTSEGVVSNAADLMSVGFGVTEAEAALVARWMLGDPALKNKAVLGAMVNSSPTEVGGEGVASLTYVGASDGMLHAFHSRDQNVAGTTYSAGTEAFAYIPQDMAPVIRQLFAQGGQRPSPKDHIFGLANSPKVKRVCTDGCGVAGKETWRTLLVMPEGYGGSNLFMLDVGDTFGTAGVKSDASDPPVRLLWHSKHAVGSGSASAYSSALGKTISLPGFYFGKSETLDDYRMIFASGYTEATNSSKGLILTTSKVMTGDVISQHSVQGLGSSCNKAKTDPTEPTVLADVAIARRFALSENDRIAAAYTGDTWGNLFRYVPATDDKGNISGATAQVESVDSFSCSHPLHFSPTIVQLDRFDATKNPGHIYITQLTNSAFDLNTADVSNDYPASQMIIRRDLAKTADAVAADDAWAVDPDATWGDSKDRMVLSVTNSSQICGIFNATSKTCTKPMPTAARPLATSTGIVRADGNSFALVTLWYVPDAGGCTKGQTYATVHEVTPGQVVTQLHGELVGNEPVIGAVFVGGKLMVGQANGPRAISASGLGAPKVVVDSSGLSSSLADRYRASSWTELP